MAGAAVRGAGRGYVRSNSIITSCVQSSSGHGMTASRSSGFLPRNECFQLFHQLLVAWSDVLIFVMLP